MHRMLVLFLLALMGAASADTPSGDSEIIDFSEFMTDKCKLDGLTARPPDGWINVPIDTGDERLLGCQMMRAREGDLALVGIMRLLSLHLPVPPEDAPWWAVMIAIETENIAEMGYTPGDVLWSRESVPIQGQGFENARAIGMKATVEGDDTPQEAHFLVFEKGETRYIITLLTPAREVEDKRYWTRNESDFGVLIRSLKQPVDG